MKAMLQHLQYNAAGDETTRFYRELAAYFEMETLYDGGAMLGVTDGSFGLWVLPAFEDHKSSIYDRDGAGLNHIGFKVESQAQVDQFVGEFMQAHGIAPAFDTPKQCSDFGPTYYQVMFVDPQGLAIEVFCA